MSESVSDLPQWAQDLIGDLREKDAKSRVARRNAVNEAITDAEQRVRADYDGKIEALNKTVADLTAANSASTALNTKLRVALDAGVDSADAASFADRLKGDDEDALKADAVELLKTYRPSSSTGRTPATDRSQGHGTATESTDAEDFGAFVLGQLDRR